MRNSPHLLVLLVLAACSKSAVPHDAGASPDLSDAGVSPGADVATPGDAPAPRVQVDAPPPSVDAPPPPVDRAGDLAGDLAAERSPTLNQSCSPDRPCSPGEVCKLVLCYGDDGAQCQLMPTCTALSAPVCGCDLVTYPNDCALAAAGTAKLNAGPCSVAPESTYPGSTTIETLRLLPGRWGGMGAQMDVTADGATFEFACGVGMFIGKPVLENYQRGFMGQSATFSWQGAYRKKNAATTVPATFSGSLKLAPGAGFYLQVSAEPAPGPGYYSLQFGAAASFPACP